MTIKITYRPTQIKKWYNVNKEAYELIYNQAKERFEDILSESESITNKSIKMITAIAALLGFFVGFVKEIKIELGYEIVFILFMLADIFILFLLIAPKEIRNRGMEPHKAIPDNFDDEDDKEYQIELFYYQSIILLQDNITFMIDKNKSRARLYLWALGIFLMIFTATATFVAISL